MKLRIKNVIHSTRGIDEKLCKKIKISDWVQSGFEVHVQIEKNMQDDPVITIRDPGGNSGEDFPDDCATRESFVIEKCRKLKDGYISITVRDNRHVEYLTMRGYERDFKEYCRYAAAEEPGRWKYSPGDGKKNLYDHATRYYDDGKILICREEDSDVTLAIRGRI